MRVNEELSRADELVVKAEASTRRALAQIAEGGRSGARWSEDARATSKGSEQGFDQTRHVAAQVAALI